MRRRGLVISASAVMCGVLLSAVNTNLPRAVAAGSTSSSLQSQIDAHNQQIVQLNAEIAKYKAELQKAGADKKTLQSAISTLDLKRKEVETQISATQHKINATQLEITQLGSSIQDTQQSIAASQAALSDELRNLQETDSQPLVLQMFSTQDISQAWTDLDATHQVQSAIRDRMDTLQAEQDKLTNARLATEQKKASLTSQRQALSSQKSDLTQTTQSKERLLKETNSKESTYKKLLARAQAELASFSKFAQNAGGSGLLYNQTSCDSWGCYYNQRDAKWGNDPLDGTKYRLKSDGCLVTSMAMVMTHYGYRNVTPVTINENPANFAAYYPAYLLFTIHVDGVSATRKSTYIDSTLRTGNPVIVGLNAYGGTHYVVLVRGSHGNYVMRDPYVKNGKDIAFSSHYRMSQIFGVGKVVITK